INDSKSTKPESTIAALSAFPKGKIILLLGGSSKKTDFHKLINFSVDRVKYILLMGETAPEFEKILKEIGFKSYKKVKNLREAVEVALNIGEKGDFFLLSPACASFDMFVDFEDRGEKFIKIVEEMSEKKS
ncbi:MAG: UDP-N-acetylmuramoyl-L-alanine--D-glutamate ligase, partial [Caldiserica bacterium]